MRVKKLTKQLCLIGHIVDKFHQIVALFAQLLWHNGQIVELLDLLLGTVQPFCQLGSGAKKSGNVFGQVAANKIFNVFLYAPTS